MDKVTKLRAYLGISLLLFLGIGCSSAKNGKEESISGFSVGYNFLMQLKGPEHAEIYGKYSRGQIVERIHSFLMCGTPANVASSKITNRAVKVSCKQSIWGSDFESQVFANLNGTGVYDGEKDKFEVPLVGLVMRSNRLIVMGISWDDIDMGGNVNKNRVKGAAGGIPNAKTDPLDYMSPEFNLHDRDTGTTVKTKRVVMVGDHFHILFSDVISDQLETTKTLQHEFGHSLGLFHTFEPGESDDLISDTPKHSLKDCSNSTVARNLMSYCPAKFGYGPGNGPGDLTDGQRARIHAIILENGIAVPYQ